MFKLIPTEYARVRPLFQPLAFHLAVTAILDGNIPAEVFVDNPDDPRAAFTRANGRLVLAGSPDDAAFCRALREHLLDAVLPEARTAGREGLSLYYGPESWEAVLPGVLEGLKTLKVERQYYVREGMEPADWRAALPEGLSLMPVAGYMTGEARLENHDELAREMVSERSSVEEFLAKSFGVCALEGSTLAGWCLSEYNTPHGCEIGIETVEPYRRRGLATAMTLAFVEQAHARGLTHVGWDCFARNFPSRATALRAGFTLLCDYPAYLIWLGE